MLDPATVKQNMHLSVIASVTHNNDAINAPRQGTQSTQSNQVTIKAPWPQRVHYTLRFETYNQEVVAAFTPCIN